MPFGIDDILLASLIGGGLGAITNKRHPLTGALMGAGLGAAGGAFAPGLLGSAGSAAAPTADAATTAASGGANMGLLSAGAPTQASMLAAQESGMGPLGTMGWKGATTGVQGLLNNTGDLIGKAAGVAQPANTALQAASTIKGMMPQQQPFQMPPPPQLNPAKLDLSQVMQHSQDLQQYDAQDELRKRQLMQQYMAGIGRGYGAA